MCTCYCLFFFLHRVIINVQLNLLVVAHPCHVRFSARCACRHSSAPLQRWNAGNMLKRGTLNLTWRHAFHIWRNNMYWVWRLNLRMTVKSVLCFMRFKWPLQLCCWSDVFRLLLLSKCVCECVYNICFSLKCETTLCSSDLVWTKINSPCLEDIRDLFGDILYLC